FGKWMRKLRKMTTEVRQQTGIDEMLRAEGLHGGLNELRSLMRGGGGPLAGTAPAPAYRAPEDPYPPPTIAVSQEDPREGRDARGALPDDLVASAEAAAVAEGTPKGEASPGVKVEAPPAPKEGTDPVPVAANDAPVAANEDTSRQV